MEPDSIPDLVGLLEWGKEQLKLAGVEDFDISAEVLLRDIVGLSRADLFTNPDSAPEQSTIEKYKKYIRRRSAREPLQYITGTTEFYNITIKCDPRALIPRPETEILVETVIDRLRGIESPAILDIGTGSGNIAITLAKNINGSEVTGIDISDDVLDLAHSNAELNGISDRIHFQNRDIEDRAFADGLGKYNCVVSNPPYVSEDQKGILQPEVTEFEPEIALFSPGDPLRFYKIIISRVDDLLPSDGLLAFEVGMGQAGEVRKLMELSKLVKIEIINDLAGIERIVIGYKT